MRLVRVRALVVLAVVLAVGFVALVASAAVLRAREDPRWVVAVVAGLLLAALAVSALKVDLRRRHGRSRAEQREVQRAASEALARDETYLLLLGVSAALAALAAALSDDWAARALSAIAATGMTATFVAAMRRRRRSSRGAG